MLQVNEDTAVICSPAEMEKAAKEKKYREAETKLAAIKKAQEKALTIVKSLYKEVEADNPKASTLKKLALTKSMINGISLYDALSRYAEMLGLIDPGKLGIYEQIMSRKKMRK